MMKKGFTLIELLAVVVVLAVVLAIAVPSISGIISSATKNAFEADAKMIIKAIELERLKNDTFDPSQITQENIDDLLNISGDNYESITITDENGKVDVVIVGKDRWDGLIAHGEEDNIIVEGTDEYQLTAPVITMLGSNPVSLVVGGTYSDAGATATDNVDGNVTNQIVTTNNVNPNVIGTYTVTYNVTDSDGNAAIPAVRTVYVVDGTIPVITMLGSSPVEINKGDTYSDAGATALDDIDGDITADIEVTSTLNVNVAGTYTITYNVSDAAGNEAVPVVRTVIVLDVVPPTAILAGTPVTNISASSVTIAGDITNNGGDTITERGVVYGTNINPTLEDSKKVVAGTTGAFTTTLINLTPNTTYHARVYATNSAGTGYSADTTFTTPNAFAVMHGGSSDYDYFYNVANLADGYVTVGSSDSTDGDLSGMNKGSLDATIVKYGLDGSLTWKKNYGGSAVDFLWAVTPVADGYVAVGQSSSTDGDLYYQNYGSNDAIIVKFNTSGGIVWDHNFGGTSFESLINIIATGDGFLTVGFSNSNDYDLSGMNKGDPDGIVVKYNTSGSVLWKKTIGGSSNDQARGAAVAADGYIVVGCSPSNDYDMAGLNHGGIDAFIAKYTTGGSLTWIKSYGGSGYDLFDEVLVVADGYIVTGRSDSTDGDLTGMNKGGEDAILVKYDFNGNVVWKKNYGGSGADTFDGEIIPDDNGFIVAGDSSSTDGDATGLNKGSADGIVVKYDSAGNVIWKNHIGGTGADDIMGITAATNGYTVVGHSSSNDYDFAGLNNGQYDAFLYHTE